MKRKQEITMPATIGALSIAGVAFAAFVLLTCQGCTQTLAPAFGAVQGVTDGVAARYGQTDTLQSVRESLAEAEARKVGRQLLPRDAVATPAEYVDANGTVLTNGVALVQWYKVERRIAERATVPPNSPASVTPPAAPPVSRPSPADAGDLLSGPATGTVTP